MTLLLLAVAPISGKLTGRLALRVPLVAGLALFGVSVLAMRGIAPGDEWTRLLPGLLIGGVAVGMITGARRRDGERAARRAQRPLLGHQQHLPSARDRERHRRPRRALRPPDVGTDAGITHGLHAVGLVAAIVAVAAAAVAWPLLGRQRSTPAGTAVADVPASD